VAAEAQLEAARSRLSRLEDIERGKDAPVSHYASLVPQGLADLALEEENRVYKTMRLRVFARRDGTLIADWGLDVSPQPQVEVCKYNIRPQISCHPYWHR
jgi:hypothetical protein